MTAPGPLFDTLGSAGAESGAVLARLRGELSEALAAYWSLAGELLRDSGVRLMAPAAADALSLESHFFSFLFLYSYYRAGIPSERRVFYAIVNQCLRGMVTGCDNLLDDEYKPTLETDLPARATRVRSVVDILVSDRVLFHALLEQAAAGRLPADAVRAASAASLRALVRSGAQEATEEGGVSPDRLAPDSVLTSVHHFKTGLLFQAPWVVPEALEPGISGRAAPLKDALYWLGLGCQLLDDLVDLARDLREGRHNYGASVAWHAGDPAERRRLEDWRARGAPAVEEPLALAVPAARNATAAKALEFLRRGVGGLFPPTSPVLARASVAFLVRRIGADRLVPEAELP